jgi:putative membrane protein insertion efficiency factor
VVRLAVFVIHGYRFLISPFLPPSCRFQPTCSRYAIDVLQCYGFWKGLVLVSKRLMRCQPYASLGDPSGVPLTSDSILKS